MSKFADYRKSLGLSQAELAKRAGLRQATLSAIENGQTKPHPKTRANLCSALRITDEKLSQLLIKKLPVVGPAESGKDWPFMNGLDDDLRLGLSEHLVALWTHSSTALEGNTISLGDTLFLLREGLTISGKSLREHQEIHGHSQALTLTSQWLTQKRPLTISRLHELHRAVQAGAAIDSMAPLGSWKTDPNGTLALKSDGTTKWHDYAHPNDIAPLIQNWLKLFQGFLKNEKQTTKQMIVSYTDLHLGFTAIHPYADGNGRMARLLANFPILASGNPPLLIRVERRKEYIGLLGDYTLSRGPVSPEQPLIKNGKSRTKLIAFFEDEWRETLNLVEEFHERQKQRSNS